MIAPFICLLYFLKTLRLLIGPAVGKENTVVNSDIVASDRRAVPRTRGFFTAQCLFVIEDKPIRSLSQQGANQGEDAE
jgi:hypothetical protein